MKLPPSLHYNKFWSDARIACKTMKIFSQNGPGLNVSYKRSVGQSYKT